MREINHQSDFDFLLCLPAAPGGEPLPMPMPDCDFSVDLYSEARPRDRFRACKRGTQLTNLADDCGCVRIICDGHGLQPGRLMMQARIDIPNPLYPDGFQSVVDDAPCGITLKRSGGSDAQGLRVAIPMACAAALACTSAAQAAADAAAFIADLRQGKQALARALGEKGIPQGEGATMASMAQAVRDRLAPAGENAFFAALGWSAEDAEPMRQAAEYALRLKDYWERHSPGNTWLSTFDKGKVVLVPKVDMSEVTSMSQMFMNCRSLVAVPAMDTSRCNSFDATFQTCHALQKLPQLDYSKGTSFSSCFQGCNGISEIGELRLPSATRANGLLVQCFGLERIGILDLPEAETIAQLVHSCGKLREIGLLSIPASGGAIDAFCGCSSLESARIEGLKSNLDLHWSPRLSAESVAHAVSHAQDGFTIAITLHPEAYDRAMASPEVAAALASRPGVSIAK